MGYVVDKVKCEHVFLPVLQFPLSVSFHHCSIFIHLRPTVYNVFLSVLQFPLSVAFHQCSIFIHSSTTDALSCFSPSASVSPVSIIPPMLHTHSFTYHRRCIIFFSQYFSFPLSVSFHRCSILIYSSLTLCNLRN